MDTSPRASTISIRLQQAPANTWLVERSAVTSPALAHQSGIRSDPVRRGCAFDRDALASCFRTQFGQLGFACRPRLIMRRMEGGAIVHLGVTGVGTAEQDCEHHGAFLCDSTDNMHYWSTVILPCYRPCPGSLPSRAACPLFHHISRTGKPAPMVADRGFDARGRSAQERKARRDGISHDALPSELCRELVRANGGAMRMAGGPLRHGWLSHVRSKDLRP